MLHLMHAKPFKGRWSAAHLPMLKEVGVELQGPILLQAHREHEIGQCQALNASGVQCILRNGSMMYDVDSRV